METYLATILLVAPGFIAKQTAKWLGDYTPKTNSQLEFIMSYFVYSLFSYCFIIISMFTLGIADMHTLTLNFRDIVRINLDFLKLILMAIVVSVFTGAVWQLLFKRFVRVLTNEVNMKIWKHRINIHDTLLNESMLDGKEHFVRVLKDDKEIAVGRFSGTSICGDEKMELAIDTYPEYRAWLEYGLKEGCFKLKTTYLNLTDNIIVEEYECPDKVFGKEQGNRGFSRKIRLSLLRRLRIRRWCRRFTRCF